MKSIKVIFFFTAMVMAKPLFAQLDTVSIKTSAICDDCKERIEHNLSFEKGVKSAVLDLETKMATVVYDSKKTDTQKIRLAISKTGYDADTLKANPKGFKRLPECCRKPGEKH